MDAQLIFGEVAPDGTIKRDVRLCAATGRPIEAGDVMVTIPGTGRFYRLKAPIAWHLTDERRAQIEAQLVSHEPPAAVVRPVKTPKTED